MFRLVVPPVVVLIITLAGLSAEPTPIAVNGNATIRGKAGSSEIVITTTDRLAGAIHSLTWDGKEFIDSHDHGRQLQSAASFDCAKRGMFWAECYNPTEAGSRADGVGQKSTSQLISLTAKGNELRSTNRMAFWLAPGEKSDGKLALNDKIVSGHQLTKRVRIGYKTLSNVIDYEVTFTVPECERHTYAQFEALTGYMPSEFSRFQKLNLVTGKLAPLDDGPGEQEHPVVLATENGGHAMGIYSPDQPSRGFENAGYGRFRFKNEKVVKWNCVFRVQAANQLRAGDYKYRMFVAIGTLDDVQKVILAIAQEFAGA